MRALAPTVCALLLAACMGVRPMRLEPRAEDLRVDPAARLPLRAAIVVPDPHGHRIVQEDNDVALSNKLAGILTLGAANRGMKPTLRRRDITSEYRGDEGMPVGRELGKLCAATFSQVFAQAELLRQTPSPGDYDLVLLPRIREVIIHNEPRLTQHIKLDWRLDVLDRRGVELLTRNETVSAPKYTVPVRLTVNSAMDQYGKRISAAMASAAKDWGLLLLDSEALRDYAAAKARDKESPR